MPPMHWNVRHVTGSQLEVVPHTVLAKERIDVVTLIDVGIGGRLHVEVLGRAEPKVLVPSGHYSKRRIVVVVTGHNSTVAVGEHAAVAVTSSDTATVASGNDDGSGFGTVTRLGPTEFRVDTCLGVQPCSQERAVGRACLVENLGGIDGGQSNFRVDTVFDAPHVLMVCLIEHDAHFQAVTAVSTLARTKGMLVVGSKSVEAFQGGGGIEARDFEERGLLCCDRSQEGSRREFHC